MIEKKEFGGVIQTLSNLLRPKGNADSCRVRSNIIHAVMIILLALLFASMGGISLAQISQNNWEQGNSRAANASIERPNVYWLEALPEDMPAGDPGQLLQISRDQGDHKNEVHMLGNELIAYRSSSVSDTDSQKPPQGNIVIRLFSGKGFALKGNETHVLRMNVELIRDIDPVYLRDLMTSNKSIDDIREELNAKAGPASLRGSLRINEISYSLLNTQLIPSKDNSTTIDADIAMLYLKPAPGGVMRPNASDKAPVEGHVKVAVAQTEGGLIGKGELIMDSGEFSGKYNVLLQIEKPLPSDIPPFIGGGAAPPAKQ